MQGPVLAVVSNSASSRVGLTTFYEAIDGLNSIVSHFQVVAAMRYAQRMQRLISIDFAQIVWRQEELLE